MTLSAPILAAIGLLLAAWGVAAGWAMLAARARVRQAESALRHSRRLSRMVEESPALPLLVRADGRIEASPKLARWLGLEAVPALLSELGGAEGEGGLPEDQLAELSECVARAQKTAAPFRLVVTPRGSRRSLSLRGHLADPLISPGGAALVWVFDFSDSESELVRLRGEAVRVRTDFTALLSLIEAAPMPMWFRDGSGRLRLVNAAYVAAVGASDAESVIALGIELIEPVDGLTAAQVALQAAAKNLPIERVVAATIDGARRTLRVSDLPLGEEGIAGYALDIEDMEELDRSFRAFREAQRSLLDQLSAGVAQFDATRHLVFANIPFQRIFALKPAAMIDPPPFERLLDMARNAGRAPEARDFPAWRREKADWFTQDAPREEQWPLADGTHLRVFAQPMPDGGLLLIVEDQTEQLRLAATADTLQRTRTATFDSLFESLAVFTPDGRLQQWNRRFVADWGLDGEFLDTHPRIEPLLERIAARLDQPDQARGVGDVVRAATLDRATATGRVALADGRVLAFTGVPLPDGNGLLTVLDISDSQKVEKALRERNAALVEADQVKSRFLATLSHEFRTPLTSIGGFAELLASGLGGPLNGQGMEYTEAILSSVVSLTEQIETALDLAEEEGGGLPGLREAVALYPLVGDLVAARAERLVQAGLTLDFRGDRAAQVPADKRRLTRAIGHLLDNAIAGTFAEGRILVEVARTRMGARVVVSDNGRGMDSVTLARVLEGLPASGADGKPRGLPLVRQVVEAHGGTFQLLSEPGQGTAAIMELPGI